MGGERKAGAVLLTVLCLGCQTTQQDVEGPNPGDSTIWSAAGSPDELEASPGPQTYFLPSTMEDETPGYFEARGNDLLDIVSVRLGWGPGLGVRVAPTRWLQAGALYRGPSDPYGTQWRLPTIAVGNTGRSSGAWDVRSLEYGFSRWYSYEEDVRPAMPGTDPWTGGAEDRSSTALEVGVHAGLIGADLSFDPWEVFDFALGVFGFGEGGWWFVNP